MAANNFVQVNRNVHVSYGADAKLQDEVEIIPIGSGGEVGRSCVIVKYKGKTIMFDCGNHPAKTGLDSLPFFDSIKAEEVDLVLITHFHLDHCGALPFFINQTNFNQKMRKDGSKGRVFMTSATKAFYLMVMKDFLRVGAGAEDLVNEEWLQNTMGQVETIEYHEEKTVNSIRFQAFNAGHVLGAAMFLVEINNVRILYTGDFSRIPDRHLFGAEIPYVSPDIVIVESTNGIREMESREEREDNFTRKVHEVVARGGKCLIPVFALGRAQELLLLLEEFWEAHKELQNIPIFYASSLAHACMKLYKTFTSGMNERVKEQHAHHKNPFEFKFIQSLLDLQGDKAKTHEALHNNGPCVVLASPGMLQSGLSLQLFERWCGGKNNGIIMAGYCVDGTLAKEVLDKPREVLTPDKSKVLNLRMGTIEAISFSAHSDGRQTRDFIAALPKAKHIILVHGNAKAMDQLKNKLTQDFAERRATVYTTKNEEAIRIPFTTQRTAKIMGKLTMLHDENGAETEQNAGEVTPGVHPGDFVSGVLLSGNTNQSILIHPDDVSTFTNLSVTTVKQAMLLPLPRYVSAQQVLETLQSYFAQSSVFHDIVPKVTDNNTIDQTETGVTKIKVFSDLIVEVKNNTIGQVASDQIAQTVLSIVWSTSHYNDLLADVSCIALSKLAVDSSEASSSVKEVLLPVDVTGQDKLFRIKCFHHMVSQFYNGITTNLITGRCTIPLSNGITAVVNDCIELDLELRGTDGGAKKEASYQSDDVEKLKSILKRVYLTLFPIPIDSGWCDCGMIHGEENGME